MYRLKKNGLRILKVFHLVAASCWLGGAISLMTLNLNSPAVTAEGMLYGINTASHFIDMWVIGVIGVLGCLITGILYGTFTVWGFFQYKWIIWKWALTAAALISAMLFLAPGVEVIIELSRELGNSALYDETYLAIKNSHLFWGLIQVTLLLLMVIFSVFKPWGKRKAKTSKTTP